MSLSNESFGRHTSSPSAPTAAVSSSPRPISLSRPHWPWTTHIHRPSSSSSSLPSIAASPSATPNMHWEAGSSTSTAAWSATAARQSAGSAHGSASHVEETIRQWNFTAFEWTVRNVHTLRDFVEKGQRYSPTDAPEEPHEVLRESPMLGDGKFKLEIVRTAVPEPDPVSTTPTHSSSPLAQQPLQPARSSPNLSLCVTSLLLDLAHGPEYDVTATMFAGLKVQDDRNGERGARADWVWEYWEKDWSFRQDSEVWECTLPSLSSLLENPRIDETDSFVICIQIHNPVGPQYPQHPSAYYVPRDLLDGVEASLDNPHTGDVKFVCLERLPHPVSPTSPATSVSHSRRTSSETSGPTAHLTARKRVLYAHSDILMSRSEYFATMLTSAFAENASVPAGERKVFEVVVEEADYVTMYWLLKWVYADWLLFKDADDPRAAVDGMGEGWSARWLGARRGGEWDWKAIGAHDDRASAGSRDDDAREPSVHSVHSAGSAGAGAGAGGKSKAPFRAPQGDAPPPSPRAPPRLAGRRAGEPAAPAPAAAPTPPRRAAPKPAAPGPAYSYPAARGAQPDPHAHPAPRPAPASALAVWLVAHRYALPGLAALALAHMMRTLQPANALPLLLASCFWDELHTLVEDYVVDHWDVACSSQEFEQCCQEVAAGEWGAEGGKTLAALFRRLRSPNQRQFA